MPVPPSYAMSVETRFSAGLPGKDDPTPVHAVEVIGSPRLLVVHLATRDPISPRRVICVPDVDSLLHLSRLGEHEITIDVLLFPSALAARPILHRVSSVQARQRGAPTCLPKYLLFTTSGDVIPFPAAPDQAIDRGDYELVLMSGRWLTPR